MKPDKTMNSKHTPNKAGSKKGGSAGGESRGGQRGALAAWNKKGNTKRYNNASSRSDTQAVARATRHPRGDNRRKIDAGGGKGKGTNPTNQTKSGIEKEKKHRGSRKAKMPSIARQNKTTREHKKEDNLVWVLSCGCPPSLSSPLGAWWC